MMKLGAGHWGTRMHKVLTFCWKPEEETAMGEDPTDNKEDSMLILTVPETKKQQKGKLQTLP